MDVNKEEDGLANEILDYSRNKLLVNMRFLDMALSYHKRVAYDGSFATDGKAILYNPNYILRLYKNSQEEMARAYFHVILHCVFMHPFIGPSIDARLWNLACDMTVESVINDLDLRITSSSRVIKQKQIVSELKNELKILTAEKIYSVFKAAEYPDWALKQWEDVFRSDDHAPWYALELDVSIGSIGTGAEDGLPSMFWKDVSAQMLLDLETFSKSRGDIAGNMIQNLRSVNRERFDYSDFLRKFAVLGEAMRVNVDEFDYAYYSYGLEHYGNMPLIEPLEYKEVKRIKEFVIAIDTSGSVMGEEVQVFLQKTYNILMQEDSYFSRINVHIIQCDAEIQEDIEIHNKKEFEECIKTMKIRGLGGTDFRPVFHYVDHLIEEKRFHNLKGLIYFTDGYGVFPEHKPSYATAFIFVQDNYEIPEVPVWAIRLVLQKEELIN